MTALIAGLGAFGAIIGSFVNVVIWRVPRGQSLLLPSRCVRCETRLRPLWNVPVVSWLVLRGRCGSCGTPVSARYLFIELATAAAFALVAWWYLAMNGGLPTSPLSTLAWWAGLVAFLWFAAAAIALAAIDFRYFRLPDVIVLPSVVAVTGLLALAAALTGDWSRLGSTLLGALAAFALYLIIVLVYPAGLGFGDVKLAPVIGAATGYVGFPALLWGVFAGFVLGAAVGIGLLISRRSTRRRAIPFGPWMLLGAWVGIVAGDAIMRGYLSVVGLA